jgi:hypothetical protein
MPSSSGVGGFRNRMEKIVAGAELFYFVCV